MKTVTKRELNQHTATVLDQVAEDEDVVVTERGRPRWRVGVFREQDSQLARLERDGRYTPPASSPAPWPTEPGGPAYTDTEVGELLDDMRGEH